MSKGFSFNGKHTREIDILVTDLRMPLVSNMKDTYESVPGRDGNILFPGWLEDKRIECTLGVRCTRSERITKLREVAQWLYTRERKQLIFDTSPDVYYMAKVTGQVDVEHLQGISLVKVAFQADPFAYKVNKTSVSKQITASDKQITLVNNGTYDVLPVIKISNANTNSLSLAIDNDKLTISNTLQTSDALTIDCDEMTVLLNDTNILDKTTGTFLALRPGTNVMTVEAQNTLNVSVEWRERFL
ncbi:phage tail family protein [Anoxybacillus sp. ST70]|uniref:distal tail protein Dit n=1 Tax=Anoxybacillus sp. ST70 TaxID=2864180 RepID=UPI001C6FBEBF|nr:distal tail protein Dit [Anoxybacillus sp. ST70]MBW9219257.1 phage tail family protein [Anoxybacillus sp. ST70]